jgi:hypothetical protein
LARRLRQRTLRAARLRKFVRGRAAPLFYHTGAKPVATRGWELSPPTAGELATLRSQAVDIAGLGRIGLPWSLVLATLPAQHSADWEAVFLPLARLAREFWFLRTLDRPHDALSYHELVNFWRPRAVFGPALLRRKQGPVPAPVVAALSRLQWTWPAPHQFRNEQCEILDLTRGHPTQLRHHARRALQQAQAHDVHAWFSARWGGLEPSPTLLADIGIAFCRLRASVPARRSFLAGLFETAPTPAWLAIHGYDATALHASRGEVADIQRCLDGCGPQRRSLL